MIMIKSTDWTLPRFEDLVCLTSCRYQDTELLAFSVNVGQRNISSLSH